MITIIPAEKGTLAFFSSDGEVWSEHVIAFSIECREDKEDSEYACEPIVTNMLFDRPEQVAVYHPSTNKLSVSLGGTVEVANREEAFLFVRDNIAN